MFHDREMFQAAGYALSELLDGHGLVALGLIFRYYLELRHHQSPLWIDEVAGCIVSRGWRAGALQQPAGEESITAKDLES